MIDKIYWYGKIPVVASDESVTWLKGYHCNSIEPLLIPESYKRDPSSPYIALLGADSFFYEFKDEEEFMLLTKQEEST